MPAIRKAVFPPAAGLGTRFLPATKAQPKETSSWRRSSRRAASRSSPSNLAIIGRYIPTPDIFPDLEATAGDRTGEIQLTSGLRRLLAKRPLYACEIKGVRHDTGNKLGFLRAVAYFALRRPDLAESFRE